MVDEARYGDSVAAEVGEYNVTAGLEAYWWMMRACNSVELVDLNEDGLEDFKDMLLSLGYPLLTENVVDHIIYKFTRSDYVSHKHREERAAYFSNKTFALDNPNAWCARSAVEELDDDGEQSGASEAAPEAATRGRAADGAMTPDATLNPEAEPPLTTKSDPSGEDSAELPPAADLELSLAVHLGVIGLGVIGTSGGGTSGGGTSGAWEDDDADVAASKKKKSRLEGDGAAAQDSEDDVEV